MARSAIIDSGLPSFLWLYTEAWAVKILNLLPMKANANNQTLYSKMAQILGLHNDLTNLYYRYIRIFGATAWLLLKGPNTPAKGNKIAPRAIKGRYLGVASRKGYVVYVWVPSKHQILIVRDVSIVEYFDLSSEQLVNEEYIAQWQSTDDTDIEENTIHVQISKRQPSNINRTTVL